LLENVLVPNGSFVETNNNEKKQTSIQDSVDPIILKQESLQALRWVSTFFLNKWNPFDSQTSIQNWHLAKQPLWTKYLRSLFCYIEKRCREEDRLSFDMVLTRVHASFIYDPGFAQWLSRRFQYIFVDEAQDMDFRQAQILYGMALGHRNLMLIGDTFQAIYRFRGCDPSWMLDLLDQYWQPKGISVSEFSLPVNYRSDPNIVQAVKNITPTHVQMIAQQHLTANPLAIVTIYGEKYQDFVTQLVERIRGSKPYKKWMILSRTQNACLFLKGCLEKASVPCIHQQDQIHKLDLLSDDPQQDCVTLGTFHWSKGLENSIVVVNLFSYDHKTQKLLLKDEQPPSIQHEHKYKYDVLSVPFLPNKQQDEKQREEQEEEERTNVRVAISRPRDQLILGVPRDQSTFSQHPEIVKVLSDMKIY